MKRIELAYQLCPQRPQQPVNQALLRNPMMDVLHAVQACGSISAAARQLGLSYRHVWGQLKEWEHQLGHALLVWERGQAAQLSEFGQRLLSAERLAQARLGPQLENLRAELERAFALAFDADDQREEVLTLYASHDHALTALQDMAFSQTPRPLHLDLRFTGSVDAIRALNEGRCQLAGFHTQPFAAAGSISARTYRPLLKPGLHKIIGFARRTQGLMVHRGNPLRLHDITDVARLQARFVNRAKGTGTRLLLDELIEQAGLTSQDIDGYDREETSHGAVAHAVANGLADVGLGTEYAASLAGLGFVPLTDERYLLVCLKTALDKPSVQRLLTLLRGPQWRERMAQISGYVPDHSGEVAAMKRLLPWWST